MIGGGFSLTAPPFLKDPSPIFRNSTVESEEEIIISRENAWLREPGEGLPG
jgi:hypothetical protein